MNLNTIFTVFSLKNSEKAVLEVLLEHGPLKAGEIAKITSTNRTSTYDYLESLLEKGLIEQHPLRGEIKVFSIKSPENIKTLLKEQKEKIDLAQESIPLFEKIYVSQIKSTKPKIRFYEGKEEVRQMMKDVLLYNDITVLAYWPIKSIINVLGADFFKEFQEKRLKNNIQLRTIWPLKQVPDLTKFSFLRPIPQLKREVRVAPESTDFTLGYSVYKNTVRFISSDKEGYGFLIESYEFAEMMRGQFQLIWSASRELEKTK